MTTWKMVKIRCMRCGYPLLKQGGDIYYCLHCNKFFRLKEVVPVFVPATLKEAQKSLYTAVVRRGLLDVACIRRKARVVRRLKSVGEGRTQDKTEGSEEG